MLRPCRPLESFFTKECRLNEIELVKCPRAKAWLARASLTDTGRRHFERVRPIVRDAELAQVEARSQILRSRVGR